MRQLLTHYTEWTLLPELFGSSHFQNKGCLVSFYYYQYFVEISELNANSVYPDQTPRSAASDLGHLCLSSSLLWDIRLKWVTKKAILKDKNSEATLKGKNLLSEGAFAFR